MLTLPLSLVLFQDTTATGLKGLVIESQIRGFAWTTLSVALSSSKSPQMWSLETAI